MDELKPPDNYMRVAHLMPEDTSTINIILATLASYELNTQPNFHSKLEETIRVEKLKALVAQRKLELEAEAEAKKKNTKQNRRGEVR